MIKETTTRSDSLHLYQVHSAAVDAEKAAIWARYSALLVAHSFMLSLLSNYVVGDAVVAFAGLLLCALWGAIHWNGYNRFVRRLEVMRDSFSIAVPVEPAGGSWNRWTDPIFLSSTLAIVLVALLYVRLNSTVGEFFAWLGSLVLKAASVD